jgi:hypothetical protein
MEKDVNALSDLGRTVRTRHDALLQDDDAIECARRRLLLEAPRARRRPWLEHARWWVPSVVAMLSVAAWLVFARAPALGVDGAGRVAIVAGEWLEAGPNEEIPVRFSDGSTALLRGPGRARVDELTSRGASMTLDRGRCVISVVHREGTSFGVMAGPFSVHVTGTRFDVGWNPDTKSFELEMHDGSVIVEGPTLAGKVPVVAGQRLEVRLGHAASATTSSSELPEDNAAPALRPSAEASAVEPRGSAPSAGPPPTWRGLAADGRYKEAFAEARAAFDGLCQTLGAKDLLLLGDTALYAGESGHARRAYESVRSRFAGTSHASTAAFQLGRIASGSGAGATQWFRTYLAEAPSGPLAREALGRILEAEYRSGGASGARSTASVYLERYPQGPHAPLARQVLSE